MEGFRHKRKGYVSRIDELERGVLEAIVEDVAALIAPENNRGTRAVIDPALVRVFPPASLEDPDLAVELRNLTYHELASTKLRSLHVVATELRREGDAVVIPKEAVNDWLRALNDVRLVLSERLGISDDADAERFYQMALAATQGEESADSCADENTLAMASLYAGISWWQGSLLESLGLRGV